MNVITTALGIQYRQQEFMDSWGRKRICYKRLSNLPKPHNESCAVCGQPLIAVRSTKKFCSSACKLRYHRQRKNSSGDLF